MWFDGDDDDKDQQSPQGEKTGDYNLGPDIGAKIGEGHDPIEDAKA